MIIDSMLDFGTVALEAGTKQFANEIDARAAGDAIGSEIYLVVSSGETAVTGTGTLDIVVETSSAVNEDEEPTWADTAELVSKQLTSVKPKQVLATIPLPRVCGRFIRVEAVITGFTGGKISAFLTSGPQTNL